MVFISKKQKKIMRERRRKKKMADSSAKKRSASDDFDENDHEANKNTVVDAKQQKDGAHSSSASAVFPQLSTGLNGSHGTDPETKDKGKLSSLPLNGKKVVVVSAKLTAKEAKKFRKEARRQARKDGIEESEIMFEMEGQKLPPQSSSPMEEKPEEGKPKPDNKKRKREFPNINRLLQEEKENAEKRARKEAQAISEAQLPDDVKDRYRAVDCEMVGIGTDGKTSVLARVSVTDWSGSVLLDTFVKVPTKVTDFRTQWSGVEAKHLKSDSAVDADACRAKVAALLKGKILVGHALKNDLDALFLSHPREDIRDTARYRPFQRLVGKKWRSRKLRDLAKEHCNIIIQQEGESHDSVDDARAAMELFKVAREAWEADLERKLKKKTK